MGIKELGLVNSSVYMIPGSNIKHAKVQRHRAAQRKWRQKNPEYNKKFCAKYYATHKDRIKLERIEREVERQAGIIPRTLNANRPVSQFSWPEGQLIRKFDTLRQAAKANKISQQSIMNSANGRTKHDSNWCKWEYNG